MAILIWVDDPQIIELITQALSHDDRFEMTSTSDSFEAEMLVASYRLRLVILGLMMCGVNGIQMCKRIRAKPDASDIEVWRSQFPRIKRVQNHYRLDPFADPGDAPHATDAFNHGIQNLDSDPFHRVPLSARGCTRGVFWEPWVTTFAMMPG